MGNSERRGHRKGEEVRSGHRKGEEGALIGWETRRKGDGVTIDVNCTLTTKYYRCVISY